jgi:hypothetical protein
MQATQPQQSNSTNPWDEWIKSGIHILTFPNGSFLVSECCGASFYQKTNGLWHLKAYRTSSEYTLNLEAPLVGHGCKGNSRRILFAEASKEELAAAGYSKEYQAVHPVHSFQIDDPEGPVSFSWVDE